MKTSSRAHRIGAALLVVAALGRLRRRRRRRRRARPRRRRRRRSPAPTSPARRSRRRRSACRRPAPSSPRRRAWPRRARARARSAAYCLVTGKISPVDTTAPDIQFRVALPETLELEGRDVRRRRLQRQHPERRRQRAGRPDRPAAAARPRLRDLRERLRPPGRRARLAGRDLVRQRRGAAQLRRRRAQEDARRRGLPDQGALCRRFDPEGVLRRRLDRRPRGDRGDHALAGRLGRRDRVVSGLEPGCPRSSAASASTARSRSRAPTRASAKRQLLHTAALQACDAPRRRRRRRHQQPAPLQRDVRPGDGERQRQPAALRRTASTPATRASRMRRSPR